MRILHVIAEMYDKFGLNWILRHFRPCLFSEIPVLAYHRIMDIPCDYPFDPGLISASVDDFQFQMEFIKHYYQPVSMSEFIKSLYGGKKLPKNAIIVTFDDGFIDNYTHAYPILRELQIPATIFVTTDFINSVETIWYERLAHFFYYTKYQHIKITELDLDLNDNNSSENRRKNYLVLMEKLKLIDNSIRIKILNELYVEYDDPYAKSDPSVKSLSKPMTWEHLREMSGNNIEIGSHTVTHPILSLVSDDVLEREVKISKEVIENQISKPVDSIAYPVGQMESFDRRVVKACINAGYKVGFTYLDNIDKMKYLDMFLIDRLHVDCDGIRSLFKSKLTLPELFCE